MNWREGFKRLAMVLSVFLLGLLVGFVIWGDKPFGLAVWEVVSLAMGGK